MDLCGILHLFLCIYLCFATTKRTIKKEVPDTKCNETTTIPLLHMTATKVGKKDDVIHYIVCTLNRPTIIIKHVMKPTKVTFNKSNICNQSGETFRFSKGDTSDLSGVMITKLFSYNDNRDEVEPQCGMHMDNDIMETFHWKNVNSNGKEVVFKGTNDDAVITLTLHVRGEAGQAKQQPKNPVTANLTEFRLEFSNLPTKYKHTRYALEVVFFTTSDTNSKEATHTTTSYIDDEYTPGIFEIWAVHFLPELSEIKRTYVTWKPVSYSSPSWRRLDQGLVKKFVSKDGIVQSIDNPLPSYSLGSVPWTLVDAMHTKYYGINVSFGIPKDGFYNKHKYLSWSGMVGSGTPPVDTMSMQIILTIAVGLGTPGLVILASLLFILIKKIQRSVKLSYDEIH